MRNERFSALLSEGLSSVAKRQRTTLRAVDRDITSELHLKEWTVQGWRRGYVPAQADHVAYLARYSVASGRVQQEWVYSLLVQARYPTPDALMTELFPSQRGGAAQTPTPRVAHNLPPLHGEFLDRREELARVLEGLASSWPVVSIEGLAGTGKTTLAIAAARRCLTGPDAVLDPPFQAVAWVSARDRLEKRLWLDEVLNTIARVLDFPYMIQLPADQKQMAVDQLLRGRRTLVVVDNFEIIDDPELTAWLHQVPEPSKMLITTRHGQLRTGWDIHLAGLATTDALDLVRRHARRLGLTRAEAASERELSPLIDVTQGNPRALGMAVGYLKGGHRRLPDVVDDLHAASQSVGDIFASLFDWHRAVLSPDAKRALLAMSFFAESAGRAELGAAAGLDDAQLEPAAPSVLYAPTWQQTSAGLGCSARSANIILPARCNASYCSLRASDTLRSSTAAVASSDCPASSRYVSRSRAGAGSRASTCSARSESARPASPVAAGIMSFSSGGSAPESIVSTSADA